MGAVDTPTRKLMTRKETATYITETYFTITARTLAEYASLDKGPPYRILGGAAHYARSDVDAWIDSPDRDGIVKRPRETPGALSGRRP